MTKRNKQKIEDISSLFLFALFIIGLIIIITNIYIEFIPKIGIALCGLSFSIAFLWCIIELLLSKDNRALEEKEEKYHWASSKSKI